VLNSVPLADKAFFVALSHMRVEFIVTEVALLAELAKRMNASFGKFLRRPTTPM